MFNVLQSELIWIMLLYFFAFVSSLTTSNGKRDFYDILQIKHDATSKEIYDAYKELTKKYHPDRNPGNEEIILLYSYVNDAYMTLKDPLKRRVYDLYGEQGVQILESPKNDKMAEELMGKQDDENDLAAQVRRVGKTIRLQFPVDLIDFYKGNEYDVEITRRVMCRCPTAGFFCEKCRGRPTIRENATLKLYVERGTKEGTVVVFKNQGDTSEDNAPGNVEIVITSKKHPLFTRKGYDLHMHINVTLKEALLGFKREFDHIDGQKLVVESKTLLRCGKTLRIPKRGLPTHNDTFENGDVVVHTRILWPKNLTDAQKEELASALESSDQ